MINAGEDEVIPRGCTVKLAEALGIADRVNWLDGLGHYTAMAELPRALRMTAEFFAQDLPAGARAITPLGTEVPSPRATALQRLASVVEQVVTMLATEPAERPLPLRRFGTFGRPSAMAGQSPRTCGWSAAPGAVLAPLPTAGGGRGGLGPEPLSLAVGRREDPVCRHEERRGQPRRTNVCRAAAPDEAADGGRVGRRHRLGPRDAQPVDRG